MTEGQRDELLRLLRGYLDDDRWAMLVANLSEDFIRQADYDLLKEQGADCALSVLVDWDMAADAGLLYDAYLPAGWPDPEEWRLSRV